MVQVHVGPPTVSYSSVARAPFICWLQRLSRPVARLAMLPSLHLWDSVTSTTAREKRRHQRWVAPATGPRSNEPCRPFGWRTRAVN